MSKNAVPVLRSVLLSVLFIFALFVGASFSQSVNTLSSCQTISSSGSYVLSSSGSYGPSNLITPGGLGYDSDCFDIQASNVVLDCNGSTLTGIQGSGSGIFINGYTNVTVENCILTNFGYEINLWTGCSYDTIVNNTILNTPTMGIFIVRSANNIVANNTVTDNILYPIFFCTGSNNLIYNNFFNGTYSFGFCDNDPQNFWNTTLNCSTGSPNIIGGPCIGGNVWAHSDGNGFSQTDPSCIASAGIQGTGICDSNYTIDSNNIDYLPLVIKQWLTSTVVLGSNADGSLYTLGTWTNQSVKVTLMCAPSVNASSCTMTKYCTTNGTSCVPSTTYTSPYTIGSEGITTICVQSTDNTGYVENVKCDRVMILPTYTAESTANADGSPYTFGTWTNQSVTVTLACIPGGNTSCKTTKYCTTNGTNCTPTTTYKTPYNISSNGVTTSCFQSTDSLGYVESVNCDKGVTIDLIPPITTPSTVPGVMYSLNCANNLSGCAYTNYCDDNGSSNCIPDTGYGGSYLVPAGATTCFQSGDVAGNIESVKCANVANSTCSGSGSTCQVAYIQESDTLQVTYTNVKNGYACLKTVQVPSTKKGGSPTTIVQKMNSCVLPLQLGSIGDSLGETITIDHVKIFKMSDLGATKFNQVKNSCSNIYDGSGKYASIVPIVNTDATANDTFGVPDMEPYLLVKRVQIYDPADGSIRTATLCELVNRNNFQISGKPGPVTPTAKESLILVKTVSKSGITLATSGNAAGQFVMGGAQLSQLVQPAVPAQTVTAAPATTNTATQPTTVLSMFDDHTDMVFVVGLMVAVVVGFFLGLYTVDGKKRK